MTNSLNKMAGKNSAERNGTPGRPRSTSKLRPLKATMVTTNSYIATIATPPRIKSISISNFNNHINNVSGDEVKLRLSPSLSNNRTSPGLSAGHFAGGKWSEPPSPATLPKPPQHWTQLLASASKCSAFAGGKPQQTDIASQLKVLLNVQA